MTDNKQNGGLSSLSNLYSRIVARLDPGLLVAALLAIFAILPLLTHPGLPNTADGPAHLMRQAELNQAWKDGILYPRWAPDLAYGYGMPLFNYAPPLLYHLTQILHLTGLPLDASMKGTLILMMLLYSLGMYLFARDLFGPRAGLLAAAVYLYAPYRLREAYIQGNYGQFCGLAFYPLILWAFHRLVTTRRLRYLPPASLALAGLLLSHNISAMLFAPLFGAYLGFLFVLERRRGKMGRLGTRDLISNSPIPKILAAIALGLGVSAFFWLPAFGERTLIRLSGITSGFFDFRHNFIGLSELLALPRPLDLSAINPYFPLSLGLAQITFAVLAVGGLVCYFVLRKRQRPSFESGDRTKKDSQIPTTLFFAVALLGYAFLAMPQSQAVWEAIPLLELAEFPWRMLGPAIFCAAVLAGAAQHFFERLRGGGWVLGMGLAFTLVVNLFYLFPVQFIPWDTPTPADAFAYEAQSGAIGTTSTGEFLPRWADRYPSPDTLAPDYAAGRLPTKLDPASLPQGASAVTLTHTARQTRIAVSSPVPFAATFRALYWPGWQVTVAGAGDGDRLSEIQITQPDGLIRTTLPAGDYQVILQLHPTPIRWAATIISVLLLVILLGLPLVGKSRGKACLAPTQERSLPPRQAAIVGVVLVLGLLTTRPLAGWFQVRSPLDSVYGAQHALRADFDNRVRLLAFDLPSPEKGREALPHVRARAGDSLPVVLYWRALEPLTQDYSVFVHLDAPNGQTYAGADETHPEDIPTSHWPSSLYLRNPLTVDLPPDLPPIRYTLTTGLYNAQSGERLPLTSCEDCPLEGTGRNLPLTYVWVEPVQSLDERDIPHRLDYRLGDSITLLGYDLSGANPPMLTLYWRASEMVDSDYTVFIHALDADGQLITQFDAPPMKGLYPTDAWLPGQIIADTHAVRLPQLVYSLAVGLYDIDSLTRLPATDADGHALPDDAIILQVADSP